MDASGNFDRLYLAEAMILATGDHIIADYKSFSPLLFIFVFPTLPTRAAACRRGRRKRSASGERARDRPGGRRSIHCSHVPRRMTGMRGCEDGCVRRGPRTSRLRIGLKNCSIGAPASPKQAD